MSRCKSFIIAAVTADGFIARTRIESSFDWTSQEDKQWFVNKTKEAGCVIFGRSTFETFNKPLPKRLNLIYSKSRPEEFAMQPSSELLAARAAKATQLFFTQLSPEAILQKLAEIGYTQLSVSGGASVYTQFLQAGVVDKLFLSVEPRVFGSGVKLFDQSLNPELRLQLLSVHHLSSQTICLEYQLLPNTLLEAVS